jgi:hypothetical protein
MVATRVIGFGYNYLSVMLIIHHGSFRSFVVLHQESGQLARDGQPSISKVISNVKFKAEATTKNVSRLVAMHSSSIQILIQGLQIIIILPFTLEAPSNKVITWNFASKKHQMTRSQLLEGFKCESKLKTTKA